MRFAVLFVVILSFVSFRFAQEKTQVTPDSICSQPLSYKFDEFKFTNLDDAKERLELFAFNIRESENSQGFYIVYGGKYTQSGQIHSIGWGIRNFLVDNQKIPYGQRFDYVIGGYHEKPTVELFIKPLKCSEEPEPTPTLTIEEVKFEEENTLFTKEAIYKSDTDLLKLLIERVDPPYADVIRSTFASGKVLLLVLIDEKGNVIKTKFIEGHIMLERSSKDAVERWKFKPTKLKGKAVKVTGRIYLDYKKSENTIN